MLRRWIAVLSLCAIGFTSIAFAKTPRPLANVSLHTTDLKGIDLKKFRGKAMVLVIFSTTCADCVNVLKMMDSIQKEYGPQGLQVVGAAGDENAKFVLGAFVARYRPLFPIGFVSKEEIIKLADVGKGVRPVAPIVIFIDRWGMVREQYYGDHPIFKDAERSLKALSLAMIRVTPVAPPAAKPPAAKPVEPQ